MNINSNKNNPLFGNLQPTTYPPATPEQTHSCDGGRGNLPPSKGFTLLEMLVSISIFMIVMLVASSALLSIIDANQKAQSLKSAINNINFALESMHKSIRVGTYYTCDYGGICSIGGNSVIDFRSSKDLNGDNRVDSNGFGNDYVTYRFNNINNSIERCLSSNNSPCLGSETFTKMTSDEVTIDDAKFYVIGTWAEPPFPPNPPQRVLITISGYAGPKLKTQTKFNLQTTVSQRSF